MSDPLWPLGLYSLRASSVHGISRQEYWSGLPFHTPGDLPDPNMDLVSFMSPQWVGGFFQLSSVQSLSFVLLFVTPWTTAHQSSLSITNSWDLVETHVHQVIDVIQPFHPLSSPSPLSFNLSQHQGLFQGVSSSHQVAKILEFQFHHQSFQWVFRTDFL